MIRENELKNTVMNDFSYHDGKILAFQKEGLNLILKFTDGWEPNQINELVFISAKEKNEYPLESRIIYQIDDIVKFEKGPWQFSLLVWMNQINGNLLEKVVIECENIIARKYSNDCLEQEENMNDVITEK